MLKISIILLAGLLAAVSAFDLNEFEIGPNIVQGENATRGQFPFYAFLKIRVKQGFAACGGSLISDEWVVTAGHCLKGALDVEVHLGALRVNDTKEEGRLIFNVSAEGIHHYPRFFQPLVWNDLGLIQLPRKVETTKTIKPIDLACESSAGLAVTAIGNGITDTNSKTLAPILQYTTLKTISKYECILDYPFLAFRNSVICVKGEQQRSACRGDSGGPLVSQENGALIGATSFGSLSCNLGYPQGYTNLPIYLSWIKEVTGISKCVQK